MKLPTGFDGVKKYLNLMVTFDNFNLFVSTTT
jgi:hypothetical protein